MSDLDNPYGGYKVQLGAEPQSSDMQAGVQVGAADPVSDTTTAGFPVDVIQESRNQPVLVDFWAPWCGPCKQLTPVLERVVREAGGRVKLVKMNIDDHPSIAGQLGIQSIPAVIGFRDGQPVDGFLGAVPESKIREFIEKIAGKGGAEAALEEALAAAVELRAEGDLRGAAQVYAGILHDQPESLASIAGLAEVLVELGDIEHARQVLERVPPGKEDAPEFATARSRIALAEQVAGLGDADELRRRLEADPGDHQARFDLALIANALGDRAAAADYLLDIMKADRTWQDDGARRQLLQFFEAWGMSDEATLAARRRLSSLLFS